MHYPTFIDIEMSSPDETGYPVELSWSLPDGSIKTVMILPDDDWRPHENADMELDVQQLIDQGVSGPDIIREMNEDLNGECLYADGIDDDESAITRLFDTFQCEPQFELFSVRELIPDMVLEEILDKRRQVMEEMHLDAARCEDQVRGLLFLWHTLKGE